MLLRQVLSPFAIEDALSSHPSVAACVAFAVPHAELGETVGLMAVVSAGQTPVRLETLRTFALAQGKLSARAWPSVLVWSTRSGLPTGRTGKPLRIGLAARLGLSQIIVEDNPDTGADSCTASVGGDSCCQCWIAHRRCDQSSDEEEWQLEPWTCGQHEGGCTGPASNGAATAAPAAVLTIQELVARANAALRSYDGTQPEKERVLDVVTASIRRLAVVAIGLEPGATSDDMITADGVLMDRGLDSMSATAFVDDICTMFCESSWASVPEETDRKTVILIPSASGTSSAGSAGLDLWTTETLRQHKTPREIAMALCDLAATSQMSRAAAAANEKFEPSEVCSLVDASVANAGQVKACVDESQRKAAVAKSAARRQAKRAPRPSKAERRAAFAAQSNGNSGGGTATASASQNVTRVENASIPGNGLHHAKRGDLGLLRVMVEEREWDPSATRDRHGLTALQWAAGSGHLEVVEYLLYYSAPFSPAQIPALKIVWRST